MSNNLSQEELGKQESISTERVLESLTVKNNISYINKPTSSLSDLMNWCVETFGSRLVHNDDEYIIKIIHNKIVMDGSFLQYCSEKKIKPECLYSDAIASWKTLNNNENFLGAGVFAFFEKSCEFLHCALFHKGINNEDEISFFVLVSNKKYDKYIKFRDEYEEWCKARNKSTSEIYVVGGNPIEYDEDITWDDIYLPEETKNQIQTSVEGFLNSKDVYKNAKVPWKRGLLFYGSQGNGKTSTIRAIISQYNLKPVTIQPGISQVDEALEEAFAYAQEHGPSLIYLEDLGELLTNINSSHFLQLLDGIESKEGVLVIATANDLRKINQNITDRPSRFDRKIEFKNPDKDLTIKYLKKWYKKILTIKDYNTISTQTVNNNFSYAYLKELYFSSIFYAIKENRKIPKKIDIDNSLKDLLGDKSRATSDFNSNISKIDVTNY